VGLGRPDRGQAQLLGREDGGLEGGGLIIPRHPAVRVCLGAGGVGHHGHHVVKRVNAMAAAGVHQAHEQVTDIGALLRSVEEAVFAVQDRRLEDSLDFIMPPAA